MKSTLLCALLSFVSASLFAAEQIIVEARFIESSRGAIPHDFAKLAGTKGIDLLSSPRVVTRSGQPAQIEIIREHRPASVAPGGFKPVPVGITVRVTPHLKGGRIAYSAQLTVSQLVARKAPRGQTRTEIASRDLYVSGTPKDGEGVWLDFTDPSNGKKLVVWLHFKHAAA